MAKDEKKVLPANATQSLTRDALDEDGFDNLALLSSILIRSHHQALEICAASEDARGEGVTCCIVVKHLGSKDESQASDGDSPPAKRPYR